MAKISMAFALTGLALLLIVQSHGQSPKQDVQGFPLYFAGERPLACRVDSLHIPRNVFERAQKKARLINLLRESLYDDSAGIINPKRDDEIRKLLNDLRREP